MVGNNYLQAVSTGGGAGGGGASQFSMSHGGTGWETLTHSLGTEALIVDIWEVTSTEKIVIPVDKTVADINNEIRIYSDVAVDLQVCIVPELSTTTTTTLASQAFTVAAAQQSVFTCTITLTTYYRVVVDGIEVMQGECTRVGNTVTLVQPALQYQKVKIYA